MNKFLLVTCIVVLGVLAPMSGQTLNINDGLSPAELTDILIVEEDASDPSFMPGNSDSAQNSSGVTGNIGSFEASGSPVFLLENGVILSTNQASSASDTSVPPPGGGNSSYQFSFTALQENIAIPFVFASEEYSGTQVCTSTEGVTFNINGPGVNNTTVLRVQDVREVQSSPPCPAQRASEIAGGRGVGNLFPSFARYTTTQNISLNTTIGETYTVDVQLNATDTSLDSAVFIGSFENVLDFDLPPPINTCDPSIDITGPTEFPVTSLTWSGTGTFSQSGRDITITSSGTYTLRAFVNGFIREKSISVTLNGIMNGPPSAVTACAAPSDPSTTFMLGTGDFFLTRSGAENNTGAIPTPNAFVGTDGQVIFSRVVNAGCITISEITLTIQRGITLSNPPPPPLGPGPRAHTICDSELIVSGALQNADGTESLDFGEIVIDFFSSVLMMLP